MAKRSKDKREKKQPNVILFLVEGDSDVIALETPLGLLIEEKYPDYLNSYDAILKQRWGYMFNMMIMDINLYNDYCEWLFDILFELRSKLGEEGLTPFHSRYYGRVGEIIFNVWLAENVKNGKINKNEIKEIPLIHMEKINWWKKGTAFLKAKFTGKKYSGSF